MSEILIVGIIWVLMALAGLKLYTLTVHPDQGSESLKTKRKNDEEWRDLDDMLPESEPVDPDELQFDTGWEGRLWKSKDAPSLPTGTYGDYMDWMKLQSISGGRYYWNTGYWTGQYTMPAFAEVEMRKRKTDE